MEPFHRRQQTALARLAAAERVMLVVVVVVVAVAVAEMVLVFAVAIVVVMAESALRLVAVLGVHSSEAAQAVPSRLMLRVAVAEPAERTEPGAPQTAQTGVAAPFFVHRVSCGRLHVTVGT